MESQQTSLKNNFKSFVNPYIDKISTKKDDFKIFEKKQAGAIKGHWREQLGFEENAELVLEIGCHKGRTLTSLASKSPDKLFLGMDITFKRVFMTAEKAYRKNLDNVGVILENAHHLDHVFAEKELDTCLIFFPDPWPKNRHQKNRLLTPSFLSKLSNAMKKDAVLCFRTDSLSYYKNMVKLMQGFDFDFYNDFPSNSKVLPIREQTTFEEKFNELGQRTFETYWKKSK